MNIRELLDMMNYNLSRHSSGKSNLGQIENKLIELFFQNKSLTDEQINNFKSNLFSNPNVFDRTIDYTSVLNVEENFNKNLVEYKTYGEHKTM